MPAFAVQDADFKASVRRSFDSLTLMRTVGARLQNVAPGEVEIALPFREDLTQHHGTSQAQCSRRSSMSPAAMRR